jgi:ribosomal protein L16/L10AE
VYQPYPYEPQSYTVKDVKIHNVDFQNKSQVRGLIELIRKDLKLKNTALEAANQSMQQYLTKRSSTT